MNDSSQNLQSFVPVTLSLEGKTMLENKPILMNMNRYFLPLKAFVHQMNQILDRKSYNRSSLTHEDYRFLNIGRETYVSLFDICRVFNLKTQWDYDSLHISLYHDPAFNHQIETTPYIRPAYLRFEDITAGDNYIASENLEKFRVVADYCYYNHVPFHVAWIPRFIDPPNHIDNDLTKIWNMPNAHFLFTLDYFISRNGYIGLHGYTHQYEDEVSGDGTEFSQDRYTDSESVEKILNAAIHTANTLGVPYCFFESPHYASTAFQQSMIEKYFNIIYEGRVGTWGEVVVISPSNNKTRYIPTPLGYVEGDNGLAEMLKRIKKLDENSLASLFYHPYAEFDYITLSPNELGQNIVQYSKDSPLHLMINGIHDKECAFYSILSLL